MENISAKARSLRISQLYERAIALPKNLIEKDNEYPFYEGNVGNPNTEGNQSRYAKIHDMEGLILDIRSYIKLCYGKESEYFKWVHRINFTQESKGFISTYLDGMNNQWQQGRIQLIQLLTNIKAEENERANLEKLMSKSVIKLPDALFVCGVAICLLSIWMTPDKQYGTIFNLNNLLAVRILLSIGTCLLLAIIVAKQSWKELLLGGLMGVLAPIFPFIKSNTPIQTNTTISDSVSQEIKQAPKLETQKVNTKP